VDSGARGEKSLGGKDGLTEEEFKAEGRKILRGIEVFERGPFTKTLKSEGPLLLIGL